MRYYESRNFKTVIELYPHIDRFTNTVGPLVEYLERHRPDNPFMRKPLIATLQMIYQKYYYELLPYRPLKNATRESKTQFNCSVTVLKEEHRRFLSRINSLFFKKPPQRWRIIYSSVPGSITAPISKSDGRWWRISRWEREYNGIGQRATDDNYRAFNSTPSITIKGRLLNE